MVLIMTIAGTLLAAAKLAEREPTVGRSLQRALAFLDRHPDALSAWAAVEVPSPRVSVALAVAHACGTPGEVAASLRRVAVGASPEAAGGAE